MELRNLAVTIATAEEARERDRLAIEAGTPSCVLMQNAGLGAAQRIVRHFRGALSGGVEIRTGPGNNGGDGWVVAAELARQGIAVRVCEAEPARSPDAVRARAIALDMHFSESPLRAAIVIDALLGTGTRGKPAGAIRNAVDEINQFRTQGAKVVALDIPTGLDATSGEASDPVVADLTISFGTAKRGHLIAREFCGILEILDIGLAEFGAPGEADVALASADWISSHIPRIATDAHKGTRKRLTIVAGDVGMAGAAILAGKGALRSGIGLLHLIVARENRDAVHAAVPAALVSTHDELLRDPAAVLLAANAVVVGPGLAAQTAKRILESFPASTIPVVLDAGALTGWQDAVAHMQRICEGREVVLTPHPAEMGRMVGVSTTEVLARRFEIGAELARETGVTVLLKGTPTVVSHAERGRIACATGTAALATGGSGDILSGMIGTLLAQGCSGFESAVCAAWVHGRAAEICGSVRGVTLDDVLYAMTAAWKVPMSKGRSIVLASLPSVQ